MTGDFSLAHITKRLQKDVHDTFKLYSETHDLPKSEVVKRTLESYLKQLPAPSGPKVTSIGVCVGYVVLSKKQYVELTLCLDSGSIIIDLKKYRSRRYARLAGKKAKGSLICEYEFIPTSPVVTYNITVSAPRK